MSKKTAGWAHLRTSSTSDYSENESLCSDLGYLTCEEEPGWTEISPEISAERPVMKGNISAGTPKRPTIAAGSSMRKPSENELTRTPLTVCSTSSGTSIQSVSTIKKRRAPPLDIPSDLRTNGSLQRPRLVYKSTRAPATLSVSSMSSNKFTLSQDWTEGISSQIAEITLGSPTKTAAPKVIYVHDSDSASESDTSSDSYSPVSARLFTDVPSNTTSMTSIGSQPGPSPSFSSAKVSPPLAKKVSFASSSPAKATQASTSQASTSQAFTSQASTSQASTTSSVKRFPKTTPPSPSLDKRIKVYHPRSPERFALIQAAVAASGYPFPATEPDDVFTQPAPVLSEPRSLVFEPRYVQPRPSSIDGAVADFLKQPVGAALEACVISHNKEAQAVLDDKQIEWGVQYQLARGESNGKWTWADVIAKADKLQGSNEQIGPHVASIMLDVQSGSATDAKVWPELDREQAAIMENKDRMLGLMGEWKGAPSWHGGQIQQIARLVEKSGKLEKGEEKLKVILEPLEKRRSHRFARFAGSRRVLQLRVPNSLILSIPDAVKAFIAKRFILLGRTYVPFHSKDGSVYMVETDQNWERQPGSWCGDQFRRSFLDFMEWHNPMGLNANQAISKFVTRFALGLSNTVPAIEFAKENIIFIDDIYASDWPVDKPKAPTEKIMTDGCGFINLAALNIITRTMGYSSAPTALQARIDGAKGLWMRHPTDTSEEPKIWIRDSQNKIKNPTLDRAHRIFELVAPSKAATSVALSTQSILNLYHNSVPGETLVEMFRQGLKDEIYPLLRWDSMVLLYDAVNKAGGVSTARLVRNAAGADVAMGLGRTQWRHDDVDSQEDDKKDDVEEPVAYTGRNQYSGAPLNLHESLMELLQAGFHPKDSIQVQKKLNYVITTAVNSAVEKYRISLNDSLSAWLVPDPYAEIHIPGNVGRHARNAVRDDRGLLKEGQVYFRSSQPLKDRDSELAYHVITGEVVLGRYPMRLPSDLQKVTAVDIPEFALYTDVLIVSVNGTSSLPSFLSGGDMDGDTVYIYRDPELVQFFQSKPLTEPPADLMEANFEKSVTSVQAFCDQVKKMTPAQSEKWFQDFLLGDVISGQKGLYSMFHDNATANPDLGYDHPDTVRLAYIFNALLDASKTGLRLKEGIFEADRKKYGKKPQPFGILAQLEAEGAVVKKELLDMLQQAIIADKMDIDPSKPRLDPDLVKPYDDANGLIHTLSDDKDGKNGLAKYLLAEMDLIKKQVRAAKDEFDSAYRKKIREDQKVVGKPKKTASSASGKVAQTDMMLKATRIFSAPIEGLQFFKSNVDELKASFAYRLADSPDKQFPWTMAYRELCAIKAKAHGIAPVIREIDEYKSVPSSAVKMLSKKADALIF